MRRAMAARTEHTASPDIAERRDGAARRTPGRLRLVAAPAAGDTSALDLDRVIWDPEYREEMRAHWRGGA